MRGRRGPEEWRRAVYSSRLISDPVKVLLLYLADHVRQNMHVSIPRSRIERDLNRSKRRVDERFASAREAGFLDLVSPGYRGHTAVYQALFPEVERVPVTSTLSSAETRTLSTEEWVTHGGHTISRADLSTRGDRRDVGSYEKAQRHAARSRLTVCEFHPWQPCPEDCRNAARETA